MSSVLERIVAETRAHVAEQQAALPLELLVEAALETADPQDFVSALQQPGVGLIAEIKRGSPSKGQFAPNLDPAALARTYSELGACAVSVLTARSFFASDRDLGDAAAALRNSDIPLLRKEFHVDRYQVAQAAVLGADAYLLIAKTLDPASLAELCEAGGQFGLTAFVEVTDSEEVGMAIDAGATAIGINNRNLHTFEEDLGTTERLRSSIPDAVAVVAASGVRSRADMQRMENCGVDAVLIGEALSTAVDPHAMARELMGR